MKSLLIDLMANLLVIVEPIKIERHPAPMKLITMPDLRYGYCHIKTTNLLPAVISATESENSCCDEAVFIKDGLVTECTKSNILIIKQGRIITHPISNEILPGIVRGQVLKGCESLGIPYEEKAFTKEELFSADEVLITSTTKLIKTANRIDNLPVGGRAPDLATTLQSYLYNIFSHTLKLQF